MNLQTSASMYLYSFQVLNVLWLEKTCILYVGSTAGVSLHHLILNG